MTTPEPTAADLRAEILRGQDLDRALARDLGRPEPAATAAAGYVETLEDERAPATAREAELVRAAKAGDAAARARLIEAFMPLVSSVARTYRSGHVERQELLQEGIVGLLRALERFDPAAGVPFWGYASWWVRQAMQQLVAELTRPVVLSDRALRRLARIKAAHGEAVGETGREPSRRELADRSGLSVAQVDDLLATDMTPRSLDEPVGHEEGDIGAFGELLADPLAEDEYERVLAEIEVEELRSLLSGLSERERRVLRDRYGLDGEERTLRDIGEAMGLSGERVRQIERRALGKLASASGRL